MRGSTRCATHLVEEEEVAMAEADLTSVTGSAAVRVGVKLCGGGGGER